MTGVTSTPGLVAAMRTQGIISADAPPPPEDGAQERAWFVTLLQGFAGWLAGLLLLGFAGLAVRPDTTSEIVTLGCFLLLAAWVLYFIDRQAVFLEQLALAISVAGQLALAWAIFQEAHSALAPTLALLALQVFVYLVMPNKVARTIAMFFACIAWMYAVRFWLWPYHTEFCFTDDLSCVRLPLFGTHTMLVNWLTAWAPIIVGIVWLLAREPRWMASGVRVFARPALVGLLLGASLGSFAAEPLWVALFGSVHVDLPFTWWTLFPLLSVALTVFVAHCGFRLRSPGLAGVAILVALLRLSWFYYLYGTSLLAKSATMLVLGVVLLAGALALAHRLREAA